MLDSVLGIGYVLQEERSSLLLTDAVGERSFRCRTADRPILTETALSVIGVTRNHRQI
jgi:hypothetical protein